MTLTSLSIHSVVLPELYCAGMGHSAAARGAAAASRPRSFILARWRRVVREQQEMRERGAEKDSSRLRGQLGARVGDAARRSRYINARETGPPGEVSPAGGTAGWLRSELLGRPWRAECRQHGRASQGRAGGLKAMAVAAPLRC